MSVYRGEWGFCWKLLPVRLIDGTFARGYLMRRKVRDGTVEYRRLNEQEEYEAWEMNQW